MNRKPAVANQFYEGDQNRLRKQLDGMFDLTVVKEKCLGVVSPHAGYVYSGGVAADVFSRVEPTDTYVIMGPNHRGFGSSASIMLEGAWEMPFGDIHIDRDFTRKLKSERIFEDDAIGHQYEHSIEVQVPFIQYIAPKASIVPITFSIRDYSPCEIVGHALAEAISEYEKSVTIVASTDMSHYEPHEIAKRKDQPAIDAIIRLNPYELYDYVRKNRVSMCGVIPTVIMLIAVKELGAKKAELVRYTTSGETSGDYQQVVGYAGLIIS